MCVYIYIYILLYHIVLYYIRLGSGRLWLEVESRTHPMGALSKMGISRESDGI